MDTLTLGLLTVCCCTSASAVKPPVRTEMEVVAGHNVLLDCQAVRSGISLLEWIRADLQSDGYVFFYREQRSYENYQHPDFHGRVKLADPRMENGNVSVVLTNTQEKDSGTYECLVSAGRTASSEVRRLIQLQVSPANIGNTEKLIGNGGDKDGGDKDVSRRRNGLIVSLSLSAVMAFAVFVVIRQRPVLLSKEHMKLCRRKRKDSDAPGEAERHESFSEAAG